MLYKPAGGHKKPCSSDHSWHPLVLSASAPLNVGYYQIVKAWPRRGLATNMTVQEICYAARNLLEVLDIGGVAPHLPAHSQGQCLARDTATASSVPASPSADSIRLVAAHCLVLEAAHSTLG